MSPTTSLTPSKPRPRSHWKKLTQAARYERNEQRQGYRRGHYNRNLTTTSVDVTLKVPKLKGISLGRVSGDGYV